MVPDLDLQLQSAIKALVDTVTPAIDAQNKMAVEQLHLSIATLTMVRQRLPLARRFSRRQLEDSLETARGVRSDVGASGIVDTAAIDAIISRAADGLGDPEFDTCELDQLAAELNGETAALISEIPSGEIADAIVRTVVERTKSPIARLRSWCLPAGFESYPEQIAAIESLL